ncbi:hypothetical protein PM015_18170, partial [Halorubrum ezzemoulense]
YLTRLASICIEYTQYNEVGMDPIALTAAVGADLLGDGRPETLGLGIGSLLMLIGTFYFIVKGCVVTDK